MEVTIKATLKETADPRQRELMNSVRDIPYRISELQSVLLKIGMQDYETLRKRRACLALRREKLEKSQKGAGQLKRLNREIKDLDQILGTQSLFVACGGRLLKLRRQRQQALRQLKILKSRKELQVN